MLWLCDFGKSTRLRGFSHGVYGPYMLGSRQNKSVRGEQNCTSNKFATSYTVKELDPSLFVAGPDIAVARRRGD
jgi:hypothetical protein